MLNGDLRLFVDADALYFAAAQRWVQLAEAAIAARGKFHVALSGGSTPRSLYRRLANPDFANRIAWDRMHVYFGDERAVPPDHADSNFRMAKDALFDHVPIPPTQVHRIEGERADIHEPARFAEAVFVEKLEAWRVTVTLPVIDHARHVMVLVSGEDKAPILRDVVSGRRTPPFPVQLINPQGMLEWYVDGAAASLLPAELRS